MVSIKYFFEVREARLRKFTPRAEVTSVNFAPVVPTRLASVDEPIVFGVLVCDQRGRNGTTREQRRKNAERRSIQHGDTFDTSSRHCTHCARSQARGGRSVRIFFMPGQAFPRLFLGG